MTLPQINQQIKGNNALQKDLEDVRVVISVICPLTHHRKLREPGQVQRQQSSSHAHCGMFSSRKVSRVSATWDKPLIRKVPVSIPNEKQDQSVSHAGGRDVECLCNVNSLRSAMRRSHGLGRSKLSTGAHNGSPH